jgi:hypothetical protein
MPQSINANLDRRIRQLLYTLKRQYGGPADVYQLVSSDTTYTTGVKKKFYRKTVISKCIILPVKVVREVATSITVVAANKMMVYGGSYDAGTRQFIFDARDLAANFDFQKDDFILYNGRRYEVKSFEELEFHTGWNVIGKETFAETQLPNTYHYVHDCAGRSDLDVCDTTGTV